MRSDRSHIENSAAFLLFCIFILWLLSLAYRHAQQPARGLDSRGYQVTEQTVTEE